MEKVPAQVVSPAPVTSITRSYYDILGVSNTATIADINEAYESLAYGQKELKEKDIEAYREATKAYQTLIDPNQRRQYDLSGAIEEGEEYDGLDVQSLGGIGRVFGAMISRFGVPLQTTISQDTLKSATEICSNGGLLGGGSCIDERVDDLTWGWSMEGRVDRQVAKFYRITIDQQHVDNGFIIFCRSLSGKFKLVLFDAEGSVLHIEESLKSRDKSQTETALYFTSVFNTYHLGPPVPPVVREQDIPPVFSSLSSFSKCNLAVTAGQYLLCVYGDNFIGRTNYSILAVPTSNTCDEAKEVQALDARVLQKKEELVAFQAEYLEAREKFEQATRRLKKETVAVDDLVDRREFAYSSFLVSSADAFLPSAGEHEDPTGQARHGGGGAAGGAAGGATGGGGKGGALRAGMYPSGETIAQMTSTATAAGGWMSSRFTQGLTKLMVASGAIAPPVEESTSVFKDVDVINLDGNEEEEEIRGAGGEGGNDNEGTEEESFGDSAEGPNSVQQQQEEEKEEEEEEEQGGAGGDGRTVVPTRDLKTSTATATATVTATASQMNEGDLVEEASEVQAVGEKHQHQLLLPDNADIY